MPRLVLYLLGPPRIEYDGVSVKFNTRKTLALLVYLALSHQRQRRDSLVNLLWPESNQVRGRALLRNSLSTLRKELAESWIEADWETVALNPEGDLWGIAIGRHGLADMLRDHFGLAEEACPHYLESLALFRRLNDRWMTANTLRCLGTAELMRDSLKEAEQCLRESLLLLDETGAHGLVTVLLGLFGQLAERSGDHGRSACLYGSRSKISNMLSETVSPRLQKRDRERRKEYEAYGPDIGAQWERGRRMSIREATAYALEG